eukprot:6190597-Pleurochrysis_carterae.AAC.1
MREIVELLEDGRDVLLACDCEYADPDLARGGAQWDISAAACHGAIITATAEQRLWQQREAEARPADPVEVPPRPARGLQLEAAKPHKWHAAAAAVWIGIGIACPWMVFWVPRHKAVRALQDIADTLRGDMLVERYRELHGFLQSLV